MHYVDHISALVGGTPLVRLGSVTRHVSATVLAKVEYLNPGGSTKDRIAERMIAEAEERGDLRPGGTIVEPTSGNTGVALALAGQRRGYRLVFVVPDKVSTAKRDTMAAYGADVVVTPTAVPPDHPDSYYSVADRLVSAIPGAWKPDQYANPAGPASHYATTGPEIWRDTDGRVTHLVAGVGTGGTITGAGRYLREESAGRVEGRVQVVGADPAGSVYSGGSGRPYLVEGVGEDFWPAAYDPAVTDEVIAVTDAEAFAMTRRLAREEALLVGGSSGMAVVAAVRLAERLERSDPSAAARATIVVILPDGGRGYLDKVFSDAWMRSNGFLTDDAQVTVADLLRAKGTALPELVHTHPGETVRDAIDIMREFGVSQLPVVAAEPPVVLGEVVGTVDERALARAVYSGRADLSDPVAAHMTERLPLVGVGESIERARSTFDASDALLVVDAGRPVGVVTRVDLLSLAAGTLATAGAS
ncbi:cystathionine beta-synthase [Actinotalea sp. M2MS4P-6]|uniref:cystathionine beta-synthase n=1 Tax=Actinotalea sp. M2MS4P-6 TaxID=2983762 RepID=UPI0021E43E73|nr:cystathionine beta-synthase [Actinotalea sp. M2MS4P-6]MCV2393872.1 cystathionine beta-synthase [Actinotalea sp. M2MS4P-6]